MEEKIVGQSIERFLEIDSKAVEIREKRDKSLADLESRYRREIQEMIESFNREIDQTVKDIYAKAILTGNQQVEKIQKDTTELIKNMEARFTQVKDEIKDEFINTIFDLKRY
ncbi:hypothetical protein [Thermosediminibacter oceani]|uniref:Uncharacterized protein n=1 Tax=Thermosediminibacter oceani (strain ATCC BAA-1034 / DSM 16646 / JW/IW-1228P) TaxID=555079 RepID=D9RYM9_THEOJ|nr:hypothetical protein [Thermosediminibacter oceani]ADL08453.1 hypothetical protein Toce_1718 [Thermosediminibacter oceani DSM 16646]